MDLRCTNKKHAVLVQSTKDEGLIEFRCDSRWCGHGPGVVVIHRFSTMDGRLVDTFKFKQPQTRRE